MGSGLPSTLCGSGSEVRGGGREGGAGGDGDAEGGEGPLDRAPSVVATSAAAMFPMCPSRNAFPAIGPRPPARTTPRAATSLRKSASAIAFGEEDTESVSARQEASVKSGEAERLEAGAEGAGDPRVAREAGVEPLGVEDPECLGEGDDLVHAGSREVLRRGPASPGASASRRRSRRGRRRAPSGAPSPVPRRGRGRGPEGPRSPSAAR